VTPKPVAEAEATARPAITPRAAVQPKKKTLAPLQLNDPAAGGADLDEDIAKMKAFMSSLDDDVPAEEVESPEELLGFDPSGDLSEEQIAKMTAMAMEMGGDAQDDAELDASLGDNLEIDEDFFSLDDEEELIEGADEYTEDDRIADALLEVLQKIDHQTGGVISLDNAFTLIHDQEPELTRASLATVLDNLVEGKVLVHKARIEGTLIYSSQEGVKLKGDLADFLKEFVLAGEPLTSAELCENLEWDESRLTKFLSEMTRRNIVKETPDGKLNCFGITLK
jgi:hypothetical protein